MNRQQRVLMLFALLLISAVMLGCANNSTVDNQRSDTPPYATDLTRAREEIERTRSGAQSNHCRGTGTRSGRRRACGAGRGARARGASEGGRRTARAAQAAEERAQDLERELEQLEARDTDRGLVLTLGDVLFDAGTATLKPGAATTVDRLAQFMRDYPERSVRIEGHTDSAGSDTANQALSEQRADAVRESLIERGLEAERIATLGYGEARPIAGNETAAGRQQNRRVEIVVSDEQGSFGDEDRRAQLQ